MVGSSAWFAPTTQDRLMRIEQSRASEELDRYEMALASMQSNAFNMINLNARRIQLENRNAIEFAELERFGGPQNARVMQQYRKQAALLEQQLHRSRDDSHERFPQMQQVQQRQAQEHAMQSQMATQQLRNSLHHMPQHMPQQYAANPYLASAYQMHGAAHPMHAHPRPHPQQLPGRPQPFYSSNWAFDTRPQRGYSPYRDDMSDMSDEEMYY